MHNSLIHSAVAFGFTWNSDTALPAFAPSGASKASSVLHVRRAAATLRQRQPLRTHGNVVQYVDGFGYNADQEATFNFFLPDRIEFTPGPDWAGSLPASFFGTVTALTFACRGRIPIHGSAVEIDGRAVLICGNAGTGKSTLAAGLIACGATLISDDLSILHPGIPGHAPVLFAGRRAIRLFPTTADLLGDHVPWLAPPTPADGKLAVLPRQTDPCLAIPLGTIIVLGHEENSVRGTQKELLLKAQLYRPYWMRLLPGRDLRLLALSFAARELDVYLQPSVDVRERDSFLVQALSTWRKISSQPPSDVY